MYTKFSYIEVGRVFVFRSETFIKTGPAVAWSMRKGMPYKERAFQPDDICAAAPR